MTRKKIHVTAEDIANGLRGVKMICPVALVIRRETKLRGVTVNCKSWSISGYNRKLPVSVVRFIADFDSRQPVTPLTFFTEVPNAS